MKNKTKWELFDAIVTVSTWPILFITGMILINDSRVDEYIRYKKSCGLLYGLYGSDKFIELHRDAVEAVNETLAAKIIYKEYRYAIKHGMLDEKEVFGVVGLTEEDQKTMIANAVLNKLSK